MAEQEDDLRPDFKGVMRINPVTDKLEPLFTNKERLGRYFKSFLMCAPHFALVTFVNIVFLNLTGIIDPKRHHALF